jgi:8-oxo-dGTP diphosphatase
MSRLPFVLCRQIQAGFDHRSQGIEIGAIKPWKVEVVDYPHALVRLHFCKVFEWSGALEMREAQSFSWERLPVQMSPVLPGTVPVLQWLAHERQHVGATHLIAAYALK